MSSRVFQAKTSHTEDNPQLCGLSGRKIAKGDDCFYLTCRGDAAHPERQIFASNAKTDFETGFRVIPSGRKRTIGAGTRWEREVAVYKWQEQGPDERWHDIVVWEQMALVEEAVRRGYKPPLDKNGNPYRTVARKGDRTQGHAHMANEKPISALEELAAVMLEPQDPNTAYGGAA